LLRPGAQAVQILLVVIVFLVWLNNTGFNITTILAGLGVGGIAVALALQKPLEDVFGALSLYTLQPVRIGDFCRIGQETGTVEEIGLRTTRIRTRANTLISIPNALLAMEAIDNYSARKKFLYNPTLRLQVDTSAEQINTLLERLREILSGHEKVIQEDPRVRFQTIGVDALELVIFAYIRVDSFPGYLEVAEDLNMRVMDVLSTAGVTLAVPARTVKIEPQGSLA
jgi:MscS family membrane protein